MDKIRLPYITSKAFNEMKPGLFLPDSHANYFNSIQSVRFANADEMHPSGKFAAQVNFADSSLVFLKDWPLSMCTYREKEATTISCFSQDLIYNGPLTEEFLGKLSSLALFGYVASAYLKQNIRDDPSYDSLCLVHGIADEISSRINSMPALELIHEDSMPHLPELPDIFDSFAVHRYDPGMAPARADDASLFSSASISTGIDGSTHVCYHPAKRFNIDDMWNHRN